MPTTLKYLSRMPDLKIKEIHQKLDLKKLELAALLEITQAINNDLPELCRYQCEVINFVEGTLRQVIVDSLRDFEQRRQLELF